MTVFLSDEERRRFVDWLAQESQATDMLAAQTAKAGVPEFIVRDMRTKVTALRIVENMLRGIES